MGDFSADWLALREPADRRARSVRLARDIGGHLIDRSPPRVVDLGSGTGANLRFLSPHLPPVQHWRMVDRDRALLSRVRKPKSFAIVASVHLLLRDLADLDGNADLFTAASLVTASALLDLVSARWIETLAGRCRSARAACLLALTYDGRIACTPSDPGDEMVRALVNEHQHSDKGFGPALGPDAAAFARQAFASRGFTVEVAGSDWTLDAADAELQRQLIDGWAAAATAMRPADAAGIEAWRRRRRDHVAAAQSTIVVGHEDLAAWLK